MRKRIWFGGWILSLCGSVGSVAAQTTTWTPASPNDHSSNVPGASLLAPKPVAPAVVVRGQAPDDQTGNRTSQFASQRVGWGDNLPAAAAPAQPSQATQPAQVIQQIQYTQLSQLPSSAPDDPAIILTQANGPIGVPLPPIGSTSTSPASAARTILGRPAAIVEAGPVVQPLAMPLQSSPQQTIALPATQPIAMAPPSANPAPILVNQVQPMTTVPVDAPSLPAPKPEGPVQLAPPTPLPVPPPMPPTLSFHPTMESGEAWYDPNARPAKAINNFYGRAEFLLWWIKNDHVPAIFTTSNTTDMGALGAPSTRVLFGGPIDSNPFAGTRLTAGYWLDCDHNESIELEGFLLGQKSTNYQVSSNQDSVIARPFFDIVNNRQASELLSFPGLSTGAGSFSAPSSLWGLSPDLRCRLCCGCDYEINGLVGLRYLDLTESIQINESIQASAAAPAPFTNTNATLTDFFRTRDQFFGAEVGVAGEKRWGSWFVDWRAKVAVGDTHESLLIDGSQTLTNRVTGQVTTTQGGLLALSSNIGRYAHDSFSVVPELNLHVGYMITPNIKAAIGYDFLYWSNVIRPGDQIDTTLDVNRIPNFVSNPGTPQFDRPGVPFKETSFYANGLNVSLEFTF